MIYFIHKKNARNSLKTDEGEKSLNGSVLFIILTRILGLRVF